MKIQFTKIQNGRFNVIINNIEIGTVEKFQSARRTGWDLIVNDKIVATGASRNMTIENAANKGLI